MSRAELLDALRRRGVTVTAIDDRLVYRAPGTLTPEDRAALVRHKPGLLAALRGHSAVTNPVHRDRLRLLYETLTAEERTQLEHEAAAGDTIAQLVVETLAEGVPVPSSSAEDLAATVTRVLADVGWIVVYSAILGPEVVFP